MIIGTLAACTTVTILTRDPFDASPAWSPNGRYLVHVCYYEKDNSKWEISDSIPSIDKWLEICTTDLDSGHRFRITRDEQANSDPSWSPDGRYVAFTGKDSLFVSTPDGTEVKQVSLGKQIVHYIGIQYTWSPDGSHLCFTAHVPDDDIYSSNSDLFLVNLSEMTLRQLTDWEGEELDPRWSPTGDQLAFVWLPKGNQTNAAQIHIIDVRSGNSKQITKTFEPTRRGERAVSELTWSPDGKLLAFVYSWSSFRSTVYLADVATRQLDRITTEMSYLSNLTWSPDGSRLAFVAQGPRGLQEIFSIKSNGTDLKQITEQHDFGYGGSFEMTRGRGLTWSPDGQFLAFARASKGEQVQRIWIIRSDGSGSPEMVTGE